MSGTDTGATWVFWGYLVLSVVVVFLVGYRIVLAVSDRRSAARRPAT